MIFLVGEVHSSKNSKRIFVNSKTGRPFISKSKASKADEGSFALQLNSQRAEWLRMTAGLSYPLRVSLRFIRQTHRIFDYTNIAQGVLDAMVAAEYLPDDSMKFVIPVFLPYLVDKRFPGCEIDILTARELRNVPPKPAKDAWTDMECNVCDGTGQVEVTFVDGSKRTIPCPFCAAVKDA
jgi:hypothetical protein